MHEENRKLESCWKNVEIIFNCKEFGADKHMFVCTFDSIVDKCWHFLASKNVVFYLLYLISSKKEKNLTS